MPHRIQYCVIALFTIILSACTTAPKKPSGTRPHLPQAQINRLKAMPLPTRLAIPVDGVKPQNLTDTWGRPEVLDVRMRALTSWLHVEPKCTVILKE